MPRISVNGEPRDVPEGATVLDLLTEMGRHPRTVAVEHDGEVLPRDRYGATTLREDDRLEIVGFVQGGMGSSTAGNRTALRGVVEGCRGDGRLLSPPPPSDIFIRRVGR